jgi:tetratricopeptide (TPR) repeat protein
MARPGKEQLFFYGSLGLTGLLGALLFTSTLKPAKIARGKAPDAAALAKRDVASAPRGALRETKWEREGREVFREPRDWSPLPPADLDRPPLRDPSYVPPAPLPSAGLDRLGVYRVPTAITAHIFAEEGGAPAPEPEDEPAPANAASAAAPKSPPAATSGADPKAAGAGAAAKPPSGAAAGASSLDEEDLKRKYDWLEMVSDPRPWYGVIENAERFALDERPTEPVQFSRRDPKSGKLQGSGAIPRDRLKAGGIHFAATAANKTELLLRKHPESQWSASRLPEMLDVVEQILPLGMEDPVAWRRAAERLDKCVALDKRQARTWELLADALASLLDFEGELKALQQADLAQVESAGLVIRHARWLARVGARAGALTRLADGVARFPSDRAIHLAFGRALLAEGSAESVARALAQFSQAEQSSASGDQRMEVIAEAGAALLEQGDAAGALEQARRILKVDPGSPLGFRLQGAAQLALGKAKESEEDWEKLRQHAPSPDWEGQAELALGIVRTRLGDFEQARANLRAVTRQQPLLGARAAAGEAELLAVTGHLDFAVQKCRDAVARAPDDPYLRYYLGRMLRRATDLEEARGELRRALELGAAFPDLFSELGYLALLEGRADDARRYFEESLAREERDETRLALAHAHLLAGDLGPARQLFEALNAKKPNGEATLGLAYCAYKRGESPAAQQLWQQVKEELPSAHPDDQAYAARWLAAVVDLESKQVWEDTLQWREVGNGWDLDQRFVENAKSTPPGSFRFSGPQRQGATVEQWNYLKRDVEQANFHEYEVDVAIGPKQQGRVGFGLAQFFGGAAGQAPQVRVSLLLAIEPDGKLLVQQRERVDDADWKPIGKIDAKPGETITLTLRRKERGSAQFQFLVDGAPVGDPIEMNPWRGKAKSQIAALFFASAPGGKEVDAELRRARRVEFKGAP